MRSSCAMRPVIVVATAITGPPPGTCSAGRSGIAGPNRGGCSRRVTPGEARGSCGRSSTRTRPPPARRRPCSIPTRTGVRSRRSPMLPVDEPLESEPVSDDRALALRSPSVPVTLNELAALRTEGALAVLEARTNVLEAARRKSIRLTHPEDWVLFKSPDDRITAYLQDA